jgi:hypothetical protein
MDPLHGDIGHVKIEPCARGRIHYIDMRDILKNMYHIIMSRGKIHYTEMYDMLKNMDPPLGFGSKCPDRLVFLTFCVIPLTLLLTILASPVANLATYRF